MSVNKPEIYTVNPFDSQTAWLVPQLASRVKLFFHEVAKDPDPEAVTRRFFARLVLGDPLVRAIVAVSGEDIVAHTIAEVVNIDGEQVLFVLQVQVDPGFSSVVDKLERKADNWAVAMQIKTIRTELVPQLNEKAWLRLYQRRGWKLVSSVMERPTRGK